MKNTLAIYIHWPFCLKKCPYCDFNSHVRNDIDQILWANALIKECDFLLHQYKVNYSSINSVFFGGGTPSLMPPSTVEKLLQQLQTHMPFTNDIEITLEANPTSFEQQKFKDFLSTGINRFSLGVQAFDNEALTFLGRNHSAKDAIQAIEFINKLDCRFSFDLIYARPHQTSQQWQGELTQALNFGTQHLSLYELTIEPATQFYQQVKKRVFTPLANDYAADLFLQTQEICGEYGLPAYEISNHAVIGDESRHNLTYWRYGDYLGIGAGAHSRITHNDKKLFFARLRNPNSWLEKQTHEFYEELTEKQQIQEQIMMGLRLREGISQDIIHNEYVNQNALQQYLNDGLLTKNNKRIYCTAQQWLHLDSILPNIL